ncbi:MAG: VWA domain-containing protein [Leptolyngbya sp. PLA1]|nr:VWA domain-containing protein [Leptolyngbya sp. PLA1]
MVTLAYFAALATALLASVAEWRHARRISRVARLAFGPEATPANWACAAPVIRVVGLSAAVWGAVILAHWDPVETDVKPSPRAARQLLVVLDVSPSMNLRDAGPEVEKVSRGVWGGRVLQGVLDRLDMKDTRVTLVAFYTKALPVLQDTTDKNVVSMVTGGLPLYVAYDAGETDMGAGLEQAFELAKGWARRSTTLVVISDGDLKAAPRIPRKPPSIADVIVIGVGDPSKATIISGHTSKQDEWTLKQVAASLGGYYHQGNTRHLPTEVVEKLASISPRVGNLLSAREAALAALGAGGGMVGLIGPMLAWFGVRRDWKRARAVTAGGPT